MAIVEQIGPGYVPVLETSDKSGNQFLYYSNDGGMLASICVWIDTSWGVRGVFMELTQPANIRGGYVVNGLVGIEAGVPFEFSFQSGELIKAPQAP